MKNYLYCAAVAAAVAMPSLGSAQTVLANWTFETSLPATAGPFAAEGGLNSSSSFASGSHASGSTVYSTPTGNGSAHAFSSNNWGVNDYYQFTTSTAGFSNIAVAWDQIGSSTGPKNFDLRYSTDGTNFTTFASYTVVTATWSSTTQHFGTETFSFDLSAITSLNEAATVTFRLVDTSTTSIGNGTVGTAGTGRIDNFSISSVPEPSTYAALFGFVALAGAFWQRRRSRVTGAA